MSGDQGQQGPRTLGNDEIHVRYRNEQDLVRKAVGFARSVTETETDRPATDEPISMPIVSFRELVYALRRTYKTLGETLHQDPTTPSEPAYSQGDKGKPPRAVSEADDNAMMARFREGEDRALEALRLATLYSEANENPLRLGDQILVPEDAVQTISGALIESNALMEEVLDVGVDGLLPGPAPRTDHGDQGLLGDWFNSGNWLRD